MLKASVVACVTSAGVALLSAASVCGQNYPTKPIRMVTGAVAGAADIGARLIAQGISGPLGQQVIVDNRGGGTVPGELVSKALADGHTLIYASSGMWLAPFLRDNLSYDPVRDFSPVTLAVMSPNVLVVHPSVAVNSVKELIALAKASPGKLNYACSNIGGASHLAAELFKSMAGVDIVNVPYKGGGPANLGIVAGQVQMMFATAGGVSPHIKSGRVRPLAVTSAQPSALFPNLPTVAASGLPGYEVKSINGLLAPAKTPEAVIKRLNQEVVRFLRQPDVRQKFFADGTDPVGSSPEEFAATIKSEMKVLGKVIRDAGIRDG